MEKRYEIMLDFFSGFYETIHSDVFDREENDIMGEYGKYYEDFRFKYDYLGYCKKYISAISSELGIDLDLQEIIFPREYNFSTDRICCYIGESDLEKISSVLDSETLSKIIKKRFTSRDGFMSFYSNNLEEWKEKDIKDWDCNELGTLLDAWIVENNSVEYYQELDFIGWEYCHGNGQYVDYEKLWDVEAENAEKEFHQKELEKLEAWKKAVSEW